MGGNYDNSAVFYDRLSRLVFSKSLVNAQKHFLPHIPANSTVLIIGGGTGWILEEVSKIHPSGLAITYVEISEKMVARSLKRYVGGNQVTFLNQAIQTTALPPQDVIITPFLFDNFTERSLAPLFTHISDILKPGGVWLNTDFQLTGKWWQEVLLKSMLLFFKILCGVESWRLPNVTAHFERERYKLAGQKTFYSDFVLTRLYRK